MLSSHPLRSLQNEQSPQRFHNTIPCITYLSTAQITTAILHKFEVYINKQTSIVPQQAQDSQCLTHLSYINNLREHSYFDIDGRIIFKQILKN